MDELQALRQELALTTDALLEARQPGAGKWDETTSYIVKVPAGRGWKKWKNGTGRRTVEEAQGVAAEAVLHHGRARIVKVRTAFQQEVVCTLPAPPSQEQQP